MAIGIQINKDTPVALSLATMSLSSVSISVIMISGSILTSRPNHVQDCCIPEKCRKRIKNALSNRKLDVSAFACKWNWIAGLSKLQIPCDFVHVWCDKIRRVYNGLQSRHVKKCLKKLAPCCLKSLLSVAVILCLNPWVPLWWSLGAQDPGGWKEPQCPTCQTNAGRRKTMQMPSNRTHQENKAQRPQRPLW